MKYLFADVDGVLNDQQFCRGLTSKLDAQPGVILTASHISDVTDQFNPDCVVELARIIRETDCKIVISSTWRIHPLGVRMGSPFAKALAKSGDQDTIMTIWNAIVGVTPNLKPFGKDREDEIRAWLEEHPCERWVAVDDMPLNLDGNSVRTSDEHGGLTKEKADEVIRKLNE